MAAPYASAAAARPGPPASSSSHVMSPGGASRIKLSRCGESNGKRHAAAHVIPQPRRGGRGGELTHAVALVLERGVVGAGAGGVGGGLTGQMRIYLVALRICSVAGVGGGRAGGGGLEEGATTDELHPVHGAARRRRPGVPHFRYEILGVARLPLHQRPCAS